MSEPTLAMVLRQAVWLYGTSEGAVRLAEPSEPADLARAAYAWLASQLTSYSRAAIGLYVGASLSAIDELVAEVDRQIASDRTLSELFEAQAIELMAETGVRNKLGKNPPDRAPVDIARQIMAGGATAMTTGTAHLAHLASAFIAQAGEIAEREVRIDALTREAAGLREQLAGMPDLATLDRLVQAVVKAAVEAGQARFTSREAGAQAELDRAVVAYSSATLRSQPARKGAVQ